jgi:hypothetical protein
MEIKIPHPRKKREEWGSRGGDGMDMKLGKADVQAVNLLGTSIAHEEW